MACALAAAAIAVSASAPRGWRIAVEALLWALAIATKLYVWPIAIVAVVFWHSDSVWRRQSCRRQEAAPATLPAPHRYARLAIVVAACAVSALLTMRDLSIRTRNPFGDFGFDAPAHQGAPQPIAYGQMAKITIASMVWTSGQHADALRPIAMLLYVVPLIAIARARRSPYFAAAAFALAAFALAQFVNAAAFVRQAHAAGLALPLGGKEGWYWYALAPLLVGLFAQRARIAAVWLVAWDVVITEVALFHDFAGVSSPLGRNLLFTWGPLHPPFTAHLDAIAVGPLASHLIALRVLHIAAVAGLLVLESTLHDCHTHIGAPADAHAA